jgi:N-acyl-aromatic-L-amino acid amidohydrolase
MRRRISRAALCGGTHGNEATGVTVVRRRLAMAGGAFSPRPGGLPENPPNGLPEIRQPGTFTLTSLISNPGAVALNRRYVDFDLNRSFGTTELARPHGRGYEAQRAQVLNNMLGPKGASEPSFQLIIDLHTTTARLGPTVIIREDDDLGRFIAAWVMADLPEVKTMSYLAEEGTGEGDVVPGTAGGSPPGGGAPGAADKPGDYPYLAEITPHGIEVEVGPVPQGVIRAETVIWTERIVNSCIAAVDAWNDNRPVDLTDTIQVYRYMDAVDYPRNDSGDIIAFVHPLRQDRDFQPIAAGDPLFLHFDGSVIPYDGPDGLVPVFINEAAYYEKHAAMTLCQLREIPVIGQ